MGFLGAQQTILEIIVTENLLWEMMRNIIFLFMMGVIMESARMIQLRGA